MKLRFSGGRGGPGQQLVWDVECIQNVFLDCWTIWFPNNGPVATIISAFQCVRLSSFGVWQKRAIFYLLGHQILTKTLALIGGPVNKDFG